EPLGRWFPGATYVSIRREDVDRQAVSWWVAIHTDMWSTPLDGPPPPRVPYSFAGIHRLRQSILDGRESWESAFAGAGTDAVRGLPAGGRACPRGCRRQADRPVGRSASGQSQAGRRPLRGARGTVLRGSRCGQEADGARRHGADRVRPAAVAPALLLDPLD